MGSGAYDQRVLAGEELYADGLDDSIEQSAIYSSILFESAGQELPAIVLTPACDILHAQTELVLTVAGIFPASHIFERFLQKNKLTLGQIIGRDVTRRKTYRGVTDTFKKQYLANRVLMYHFLPRYEDKLQDSFIDFSIVRTLSAQELLRRSKIAVLKSPWREAVPSRYAAYSLRIGVREYDDNLLEVVVNDMSTVRVE